jgi:exosortase C (VPDSG-CTERM-specific)
MNPPDATVRRRLGRFLLAVGALVLGFSRPLYLLVDFAFHSELHSYIPLIPLISLGLVWLKLNDLPKPAEPDGRLTAFFLAAGLAILAGYGLRQILGLSWSPQDALTLNALAFVFLFAGLCAWVWGRPILRAIAFPLAFLLFIAPIPVFISSSLETFLQYCSAVVAYGFFQVSGMAVLPQGDVAFRLPGITLDVAPECSGLHSTMALIITSLPAGYLFLRSPWNRAWLCLAAIPFGIIRNGFRIFTIGELCVHLGPQMINSYIHRSGGWMFFLLSLGLFIPLLLLLARLERRPADSHRTAT